MIIACLESFEIMFKIYETCEAPPAYNSFARCGMKIAQKPPRDIYQTFLININQSGHPLQSYFALIR